MTTSEWLAVLEIVTVLLLGLPLIRALAMRAGASPEVARKSVHVATGCTCVALPWIFERPLPVWVLTGVLTIW